MAPPRNRYQIVVAQRSYVPSIWDWEIYRDGEPLPARLQGSGLRSEVAAKGMLGLRCSWCPGSAPMRLNQPSRRAYERREDPALPDAVVGSL
jgi:hypothetical protein